jgi:quercetin dioxygenase-like cupin family protein
MRTGSPFGVSCFIVLTFGVLAVADGQERGPNGRARNPGLPGWCDTPVADRRADEGCYTTAVTEVGVLPREPLYWHLDTFSDRAAAEAKRGPRGTVVDGHGKHWLFTIAGQTWRPGGGDRVATIGPLVVDSNVSYTARYLETVIRAGFQDATGDPGHRHPGPEVWFLIAGGQCLETPNGVVTAQAGQSMLAPEGWPMSISSLGPDTRRALVLVLHRTSERYVMPVDAMPDGPHAHWRPKGLCADAERAALSSQGAVPEASRGCERAIIERKSEIGCYTTAETPLGVLPADTMFWHLYTYPSRAAAEAARGPRGTVAESFGRHWVFTIAEEHWHPAGGERIALVGPLVVKANQPHTARYMEALYPPGAQTPQNRPGHRHPGPEAWYVLSGAQCLETPNGLVMVSAGGTAMVPEGWPMAVSGVGSEIRRTIVLILHPSSEPASMAIDDPRMPGAPHSHWKPRGLCPQ